ncbi:MAG: hypothetical protein JWL76_2176 [Thermoleophilia bacterium]|nr:hypothetical protein [Thermoleophilia bacterium]
MNQPAPDWPSAPTPDAPPAPMAAPPAPPAPAPLGAPPAPPLQAMPQFAMPTSAEAALDVTAPLMPIAPQQPTAPAFAAPDGFAAPEAFAAPEGFAAPGGFAPQGPLSPATGFAGPQAGLAAPHQDHPTSLAMPTADHAHVSNAMPTFAEAGSFTPQQLGGATAAHPGEFAGHDSFATDVMPALGPDLHAEPGVDPTGQWWAPGIALVLAVAALAWQLVAFYARVQLPEVRASQTPLTNFDNVVSSLPLASSSLGQIVGVLLAAGALGIVLYGSRRGLREPQLQVAIGAIAAISLLAMVALPVLRG